MITLYHAPRSRSSSIVWLLEELGQPYQIALTPIIYGNGEGAAAPESYRAIHPHKKVPALDHDGTVVFESAAIALYLPDAFPDSGLAPPVGDRARGKYFTLLAYWAGVMNPVATARFQGWDKDKPTGFGTLKEMVAYVDKVIGEADPWLLGKRFSSADVMFAGALDFFLGAGMLPRTAHYEDYLARLNARPARKRALERDNG